MELVYLWVEDYKNIKKQGFNFSPKFRCEFKAKYKEDENGNKVLDEENSELIIEENDDYIENFFGKNINVTAIVGKNGSGKSSILEVLDNLDCSDRFKYIFFKDNKFYRCFECLIKVESFREKYIFEKLWYIEENAYEKNSIASSLLSFKNDTNPLESKEYIIGKVLEKNAESFDFINEKFSFKYWEIEINKTLPRLGIGLNNLDEKYMFHNEVMENEINYLNIFVYVAIKLIKYILGNNSLQTSKYWTLLERLNEDFTEENYLNLVNAIDLERFNNIGNYNLILETLQHYYNSVDYINKFLLKREILTEEIQEFINSGVYKTFYGFSSNNFKHNIIEINYLTDKDLKFLDLSSGEKERISNIALLIDCINNKEEEESYELDIIMIDEPDTFLHPNWQKKIINDFTFILNKFQNNKINLVLTTHSPFLLSDIPKQNIIFLDTDENGNCIVVDGLNDKKETFGANIHTLLSDSFFMDSGLMGEFAKSRIDEVIKLLNKEHLKPNEIKYCEQIISIIGEPIIKNQLQKMLDSKRLKKIDKIDEIEKSIQALQEELEKLKNAKS